jgi:hypothetical protein
MRLVVGCLAIVGALAACTERPSTAAEPTVPPSCTMNEVPGISLFVVDSIDGPFRGPVTATLREVGGFSQTIAFPATYGLDQRYLAYERAGNYSITLEAPGYKPWRRENVTVANQGCHVKTVFVTALMQR